MAIKAAASREGGCAIHQSAQFVTKNAPLGNCVWRLNQRVMNEGACCLPGEFEFAFLGR